MSSFVGNDNIKSSEWTEFEDSRLKTLNIFISEKKSSYFHKSLFKKSLTIDFIFSKLFGIIELQTVKHIIIQEQQTHHNILKKQ